MEISSAYSQNQNTHLLVSQSWSSLSFSSLVSELCGCFCTIRIPPALTGTEMRKTKPHLNQHKYKCFIDDLSTHSILQSNITTTVWKRGPNSLIAANLRNIYFYICHSHSHHAIFAHPEKSISFHHLLPRLFQNIQVCFNSSPTS